MWGEHSTFVCQEHRPGGKGARAAITGQLVRRTCLSTIFSLTIALGQASPQGKREAELHQDTPKEVRESTDRCALHPFGPVFHKTTVHPQERPTPALPH